MKQITHAIALKDSDYVNSAVIILPGRGSAGTDLALRYQQQSGLVDAVFVGVTPDKYEWYPAPHGPDNQKDAIAGLPYAVDAIKKMLETVQREHDVRPEKTAIVGFSAGAVVAIETALNSDVPIGAIVAHCGAVLEPEKVQSCKHRMMPFLLAHNQDDTVFEWNSRYVPMRDALVSERHNVFSLEKEHGGHHISDANILSAGSWIAKHLGTKFYSQVEKPEIETVNNLNETYIQKMARNSRRQTE